MRLPLREIRRRLTCLRAPTYRLCVTDNFRGRGLMDERGITGRTVTLAVPPAERVVLSNTYPLLVLANKNDDRPDRPREVH